MNGDGEIKPGYKTTEAWASIITSALLVLVGYGIFTQEQAKSLEALILPAIPLILAAVTAGVYTVQRTHLKGAATVAGAAAREREAEVASKQMDLALQDFRMKQAQAKAPKVEPDAAAGVVIAAPVEKPAEKSAPRPRSKTV